ncbi:MAG: hypothetical protein ACRCXB_35465 [Aeromonadaceae bacterium]
MQGVTRGAALGRRHIVVAADNQARHLPGLIRYDGVKTGAAGYFGPRYPSRLVTARGRCWR